MSTAFANRFQLIVDELANGSKKQFAELTQKSVSHIYKICRGASRPSMAYMQKLYDDYQIDLTWLVTGEHSNNMQATGFSNRGDMVYAPIFDVEASAGFGADVASEAIDEYFAFNKSWLSKQLGVSSESLLFVNISGDSMEPTLQDGDQVLVDMTQQKVHSEGVFLLQTETGLMAKRLKLKPQNTLQVTSDNSQYPSWEIRLEEQEFNPVSGKVVWSARKL